MLQGQSEQVGLLMMNRAFSRFTHVIGYSSLCGAILETIGYQAARPTALVWPALIGLIATLAALALVDRRRTATSTILFLSIGAVSLYVLALEMFSSVPSVRATNAPVLSFVGIALVLVVGSGFSQRAAVAWCTAGFVLAIAAPAVAAVQTDRQLGPDIVVLCAYLGIVFVETTVALTRPSRMRVTPDLDRAVAGDQIDSMRYRIEVRAAALLHDVVLVHLNEVAGAADEHLRPALKRQIEQDLQVLIGEQWLADAAPDVDTRSRSDWRQSAVFAAVREARELSLIVEVTGDFAAVSRLDSEHDLAVGVAVKQCLVNVLRHAQIDRAEVVVLGSEFDVSFMVIDAGRGFSEQLVEADRLGIRQSVRRRIESVGGDVKVWSTPGRGTSVMIRVPARDRWAAA